MASAHWLAASANLNNCGAAKTSGGAKPRRAKPAKAPPPIAQMSAPQNTKDKSHLTNRKDYPPRDPYQLFTPSGMAKNDLWSPDNDFMFITTLAYRHPMQRYRLMCPTDGGMLKQCQDPKDDTTLQFACCKCPLTYDSDDVVKYNMFFLRDEIYPDTPNVWTCPRGCYKDGGEVGMILMVDCRLTLFCRVCLGSFQIDDGEVSNILLAHEFLWSSIKGLHYQLFCAMYDVFQFYCLDCIQPMYSNVDTLKPHENQERPWENVIVYAMCPVCEEKCTQRDIACVMVLYRHIIITYQTLYCPLCQNELRRDNDLCFTCDKNSKCKGGRFTPGVICLYLPFFVEKAQTTFLWRQDFHKKRELADLLFQVPNFFPRTDTLTGVCLVPNRNTPSLYDDVPTDITEEVLNASYIVADRGDLSHQLAPIGYGELYDDIRDVYQGDKPLPQLARRRETQVKLTTVGEDHQRKKEAEEQAEADSEQGEKQPPPKPHEIRYVRLSNDWVEALYFPRQEEEEEESPETAPKERTTIETTDLAATPK